MTAQRLGASALACSAACLLFPTTSLCADDEKGIEYFETHIRPVLIDYCYECHSSESDEPAGGLRLDHREGMQQGGELGPAVVPKDPAESLILSALRYEDLEMPPDEKLDDAIIEKFETWIRMGAPDPRTEDSDPPPKPAAEAPPTTQFWSLKPVVAHAPPAVTDADWVQNDIDRFVLARKEQTGLRPVRDAAPEVVLRRLSFALLGLPPSPDALNSVQGQSAAEVTTTAVDNWLASPRFGERWGRHWLDVVRYGESTGSSRDVLMLYSWRYRDYVIDAFNADMPWDQFVREQIAGDLLPSESEASRRRQIIATGLLAIGSKSLNGGNLPLDIADDQINVVSRSFMGLTVSCARCHDHKFDPIPTADYYALAGIFRNTRTYYGGSTNRPKNDKDKAAIYFRLNQHDTSEATVDRQLLSEIADLQKSVKRLETQSKAQGAAGARAKRELTAHRRKLVELRQQLPPEPDWEYAFAVQDLEQPRDWPIQVRGEKNQNGPVVPRGFLNCVSPNGAVPIPPDESGRRQLAEWLTSPQHPLTARVIVNRVWQHLFGQGLVTTVDNFGTTGQPPSHPQLLDWLTHRFMHHHEWSVKSLIREIVTSHTWQQSADFDQHNWELDPENTLLWRANRRRLEAEAIRDAMLTVAGNINLSPPHGSLVESIGEGEVGRNIRTDVLNEPFPHRSVYLPIIRGLLPEMLQVFDFPEPSNPQGQRSVTNVPTQSLFLLNSPFVIDQSRSFAKRVIESSSDDSTRMTVAWQSCFGRPPSESERNRAMSLLGDTTPDDAAALESQWVPACHALLASAEFRFVE